MLEQDDYFSATDLGLEDLNPYVNVNISEKTDEDGERVAGSVLAIIEVQENLRFHAELHATYPSDDPVFTEAGEITEHGFRSLEQVIEGRYKGEAVELLGEDTEEPYIKFELVLEVPEDTSPEDLGTLIWEGTALVQFHNEADPGTFGVPYLFGTLIEDYRFDLSNA